MSRLVVDASVVVKWVVPEPGHEVAAMLLRPGSEGGEPLLAPDLVIAESCNAVAKKVGREITCDEAAEMISQLLRAPINLIPCRQLALPALAIARDYSIHFYDALYVAAARHSGLPLLTADVVLVRSARAAGLPTRLIPLDEYDG